MYTLHGFCQSGNTFKVAFMLGALGQPWLARFVDYFGGVDKHLAARRFLIGYDPTIADFSLSGYLFYPVEDSGYDSPTLHPNIAAWVERLRALPGWADPYEVLPGERLPVRW